MAVGGVDGGDGVAGSSALQDAAPGATVHEPFIHSTAAPSNSLSSMVQQPLGSAAPPQDATDPWGTLL